MHVAVLQVPKAGLVVEDVVLDPAIRAAARSDHDVLHPAFLKRRTVGDIGVVRVVCGDVLDMPHSVVFEHTVAVVRNVGIGARLYPVPGH